MATTFSSQTLFGHSQQLIAGTVKPTLDASLNRWQGVLPLVPRFAGRSFCTPGQRLRINPAHLYPEALGVGLDEDWICCTSPIVTGTIDASTGQAPFREGEAHVITPDGHLVSLQELIEEDPASVIGPRVTEYSRRVFGKPTWPIVSKKFDNKHPIPHHLHWKKWEVYDVNQWDNPGVHPSHHFTTAMGLYPWVTREMLLECMKSFGKGYNGVRYLSPHVLMRVGYGFKMPNGVLHAPVDLVHHELHVLMDEHFLAEDLTRDGKISADVAFLACREEDYPASRHGDWEYLVDCIDFEANQQPNFVLDNTCPPLRAPQYCGDGVEASWIVHGKLCGEQQCSILRVQLKPGARHKLPLESPCVMHTNAGRGRVGGLDVEHAKQLDLGGLYYERALITPMALADGGLELINSGDEEFVITLDFPQDAHAVTPGE
jgi:hypothetical protein